LEKLKRRIQEGKYEDKEKATRKKNQLLFIKTFLKTVSSDPSLTKVMRVLCFET
jgi:hypothetical protein